MTRAPMKRAPVTRAKSNNDNRLRSGLALPLALMALVVVALMGAMVLDAALQDLRLARAGRAQITAQGLAESALAPQVEGATDSSWLRAAPGSVRQQKVAVGRDTITLTLLRLGGRFVRVSSAARSRVGGSRGDAGMVAYLLITGDSAGALRLQRVPGWWWAPDP